ncbi:MAG: hypothetical protein ABEJ86_03940 [Halococcoides sp.]
MTDSSDGIDEYYDPLTNEEHSELEHRLETHRDRLEAEGYEVTIAEGDEGFFAGVLVIDDEQGRFGFLDESGSIEWVKGNVGGVGALGHAIAQNPGEKLESAVDGLDAVDVE